MSGRILANPSNGPEPPVEFFNQIADSVANAKESGAEESFQKMINCVKLFFLGKPNGKGEASPGPLKVFLIRLTIQM